MKYTDARKRTNMKWDKANMVNVSCRMPKQKKERFRTACEKLGTTMYAELLKTVDRIIAQEEKGEK